jgi:hypothetical protein
MRTRTHTCSGNWEQIPILAPDINQLKPEYQGQGNNSWYFANHKAITLATSEANLGVCFISFAENPVDPKDAVPFKYIQKDWEFGKAMRDPRVLGQAWDVIYVLSD